MEAKNVPLAGLLGDDIKHVLGIDVDLTGITPTFRISAGPEQPAIITATVNVIDISTDDDGFTRSVIDVFKAAADVRTAIDGVGGLPGNEPLVLFHQLQLPSLPDDVGANAITTIIFGDYTMKGSVNG